MPAERAGYRAWKRTLLDTTFSLPESYVPPQLVSTTEAGFEEDLPIRVVVVEDLAELRRAAEAAGTPVGLLSAYRSYEQQAMLFEKREAELGHEGAIRKTARPGHSEHQLGTAVDFKRPGHQDVFVAFGSSPAGRWLATHGWEFGFVPSYPQGKQDLTCYGYEPWHYRYFGKETAARIHESGLTTRQYLWQLEFDAAPEASA
jgi:D-alanyl-D-alanine carboxypeptidase